MGNTITFDGYFDDVFQRDFLANARKHLANVNFDTCVGTGLSGTIGAAILARGMRKNLAIVRKVDDGSTHSHRKIEGTLGQRWLFVDDFISLGRTRRRVIEVVDQEVDYWNGHRNEMREICQGYLDSRGYIPSFVNGGVMPEVPPPHATKRVGSYLYREGGYFTPSPFDLND